MAEYFPKNTKISLSNGNIALIKEKLGEGGQGVVYRVLIGENEYALKWYHKNLFTNSARFYRNLENNVKKKAPANAFLWPLYLTNEINDSFGYIMKLRDENYKNFSEFLLAKVRFASIAAAVNACLTITNGFRELHRIGFSYQDLNDGNFFIDPVTGDVLICDNDNVAPYGESLGIAGKARYMAPEVVRNKKMPDIMTDRFSLSVILFRLLFLDHPLEGKKVLVPCLTEELELKFYGRAPIFIYDPEDDTNRPVRGVHGNVIRLWHVYPSFVREKFTTAFSGDAMNGKVPRITDSEWQILFTRLRDVLITCPCGSETFLDIEEESSICLGCGIRIPRPPVLEVEKYKLPLFPGQKIYRCHTDTDSDDYSEICGEVVRNPGNPKIWGLKNLIKTEEGRRRNIQWVATCTDRTTKVINPGEVLFISRIREINFGNCIASIRSGG